MFAPIVRAFDGAGLIRVKSVGVPMRFGGEPLVELRKQRCAPRLPSAVEQGAASAVAFTGSTIRPLRFCESMSPSK